MIRRLATKDGVPNFCRGPKELQPEGHEIKNLAKVVKGMKLSSSLLRDNLRKIRNFVRTSAAPTHHYGHTIVGADLKVTEIHQSTIASATGYMVKCASHTLAPGGFWKKRPAGSV